MWIATVASMMHAMLHAKLVFFNTSSYGIMAENSWSGWMTLQVDYVCSYTNIKGNGVVSKQKMAGKCSRLCQVNRSYRLDVVLQDGLFFAKGREIV